MKVGDGYGLGVVADGSYFHFDSVRSDERLRRIDLTNGKVTWTQSTPLSYRDLYGYENGPRSSPTIDNGQIFTLGVAGQLIARDMVTGQIQWEVDTNSTYGVVQNFFGVGSAPLVLDDLVMVMVGGSPAEDQAIAPGRLDRVSPNGSLLVALDRTTGQERWKCGDDLASYSSPRTIMIDNRKLVLVFGRDYLHLIDPVAGESLAEVRYRADILESVNAIVPVVKENRVLVADCYDLGATVFEISLGDNGASFKEVWKDPEGNRRAQSLRSHLSTPILKDGLLYACSGRNAPDSDFRCVDFNTGEVLWTALQRRRTTATLRGDKLFVLKETGPLHVVRCTPEKFDELAVWPLDTTAEDRPAMRFPCWAAPIIVGNQMLVRGDENLLCLQLSE